MAVRPGSEEYLDSEKYQIKKRDWQAAREGVSLIPLISALNQARKDHTSFHHLRNLTFHQTDTDRLLAYSKRDGDDVVLVVVALDPHDVCEGTVRLNMMGLGLSDDATFVVHDLLSRQDFTWQQQNFVRLDPRGNAAHIFRLGVGASQ